MITQRFVPSSHLPEYFKADIELGTPHEFSFSTAIDTALQSILLLRLSHLNELSPDGVSNDFIRAFLNGLGFNLAGFTDLQASRLYSNRVRLFELRGKLAGLDLLAKLHFDQFHSDLGLPFPTLGLNSTRIGFIQVSEVRKDRTWITYTLYDSVEPELIDSFLQNSEMFISKQIQIYIRPHNRAKKKPIKTNRLKTSFQLTPRRISCPIFQK
jgi:hypothetical protein